MYAYVPLKIKNVLLNLREILSVIGNYIKLLNYCLKSLHWKFSSNAHIFDVKVEEKTIPGNPA